MEKKDCKIQCHYCKEVFVVPTLTSKLPAHKNKGAYCQGSEKAGLFISVHFPTKK